MKTHRKHELQIGSGIGERQALSVELEALTNHRYLYKRPKTKTRRDSVNNKNNNVRGRQSGVTAIAGPSDPFWAGQHV